MRVLMTSAPAIGHVAPLLGLGQALRDAGHRVLVATHPEVHGLITDAGLAPVAAGMSGSDMTQERIRRWPETTGQPATSWAVRMFTQILAPTALAELDDLVDGWKPDLVIHEEGEYAGPVAAARAGIRWVTHAWGSPTRPLADLDILDESAAGLWDSAGLSTQRWGGLYRHGLVNPCPPALQATPPGAAIVWAVKPHTLSESAQQTAPLAFRPEAYVGFGTVPIFAEDPRALTAAADGCAARGLRTLVTTRDDHFAQRLVTRNPQLVLARAFVELAAALSTCRLVVCHGGAGTVLAALGAGVPLVIVSKGTPSQARMAAACVDAGVAIVADEEPASIDAAIGRILDEPNFKERASFVADQMSSMPQSTELIAEFENLVQRAS